MKKLRITESVCGLSTTTELNVIAIVAGEGNIITDSRIYGKDKQEIHRFNLRNFKQLIRTGWYELRIAANCTITYNLIDQEGKKMIFDK